MNPKLRIRGENMATRVEIEGWLSSRKGEISVDTIVNKIKSLDSLKSKNSALLVTQEDPYKKEKGTVKISELTVDMSYQRTLNLKKILSHLKKSNGQFDKFLAGHIDVCKRPNGKLYVWDGFRRSILAGLKGIESMPASYVEHENLSILECQKLEAEKFEIKNAYAENMKREEIWKSQIVQNNKNAIMIKNFLANANLDVLKVLSTGYDMSSFAEVEKVLVGDRISQDYLIEASLMIQKAWSNENSIKGYVMLGLGKLLEIIDRVEEDEDEEYNGLGDKFVSDLETIEYDLKEFAKSNIQWDLQNPRLNNNLYGSIAYNIATKVCKLDKIDRILVKECDVKDMLLTN
jgi:hypothetical protein|tara:strand:- start:61 stop:1101 length:1041 start_codon:yes stop_codon:yes gene_type:complete